MPISFDNRSKIEHFLQAFDAFISLTLVCINYTIKLPVACYFAQKDGQVVHNGDEEAKYDYGCLDLSDKVAPWSEWACFSCQQELCQSSITIHEGLTAHRFHCIVLSVFQR